MRYLGGKSRIAKHLAAEIDKVRKPGEWIWEPFCGGLSMTVALSKNGPVWATDANPALIALYQAVRDGWDPPNEVSRETYQAAKALPDSDPMKAFCGFGCSFSGKWFGGYAKSAEGRSYASNARNQLTRHLTFMHTLDCANFLSAVPRPTSMRLYCDPPYRGTTAYDALPSFDSDLFVSRVIGWSRFTDVWVSEYQMPFGQVVWSGEQVTTVSRNKAKYAKATERLYYIARGSLD